MVKSINPYTGEDLAKFNELTKSEVNKKLKIADKTFENWRHTAFAERSKLMMNLAGVLKKNKKEYAKTITLEMGKPISQSIAEVEKCAWVCEYYAKNAEEH